MRIRRQRHHADSAQQKKTRYGACVRVKMLASQFNMMFLPSAIPCPVGRSSPRFHSPRLLSPHVQV